MASALSSTVEKRKIPSENNNNGNQSKKGHWSTALSTALDDESVRLYKDELCTVIKDKFPKVCSFVFILKVNFFLVKARIHLLVMPNEFIADLKSVNKTHLPLLKHMLKIGKEIAEK
jgi:hypothetical protein